MAGIVAPSPRSVIAGPPVRPVAPPVVTLVDAWFLSGVLAELLSLAVETVAPVKFSEFVLLGALLARGGTVVGRRPERFRGAALALIAALSVWAVLADAVAGNAVGELLKTAFRFPVLLLPIVLFATAETPLPVMTLAVGMYAAKWLFFMAICVAGLIGVDTGYTLAESAESVKWITPMPAACLLIFWVMRPVLSPWQGRLWGFAFVTTAVASLVTLSRTSFLIIVIGFGAALADRAAAFLVGPRLRSFALVLVVVLFPLVPIVGTVFLPSDAIYGSDFETPSNLERTFLLETGLTIVQDTPVFGIGSTAFRDYYAPWFNYLFKYSATVDSAHNIVMDLGVAFGMPAIALFALLYLILARWAFAVGRSRAVTIIALFCIAMTYSFLPTAGLSRFQTTLLWFLIFLYPRWVERVGRRDG